MTKNELLLASYALNAKSEDTDGGEWFYWPGTWTIEEREKFRADICSHYGWNVPDFSIDSSESQFPLRNVELYLASLLYNEAPKDEQDFLTEDMSKQVIDLAGKWTRFMHTTRGHTGKFDECEHGDCKFVSGLGG